jgi:hypothetical protein
MSASGLCQVGGGDDEDELFEGMGGSLSSECCTGQSRRLGFWLDKYLCNP